VIFIHKRNIIRKEYIIRLQIYSAVVLPNIIKIGQRSTFDRVITKNKKGELFETQCTHISRLHSASDSEYDYGS